MEQVMNNFIKRSMAKNVALLKALMTSMTKSGEVLNLMTDAISKASVKGN